MNSALQRARAKLERERPARSQQETLRALGDERSRELVARFVDAWNRADVAGDRRDARRRRELLDAAAADLVPGQGRHRGVHDARIFRSSWRFELTSAGGQPALLGRRPDRDGGPYELRALTVLTFEGERIAAMTAFLGPGVLGRFRRRTDDFGR